MNSHVHPVFAGVLAQFEPIQVGKVAPAPTRIPAPRPLPYAAPAGLTNDQVEAFTDAADADAVTKMREELVGMFVRAVEAACTSHSTPRVPTFVSFCVNDEHDSGPKRFRLVLRMQPVTVVLHDMLSASEQADAILLTYTVSNEKALSARALHIGDLSRQYAEANAAAMVKLGWSPAA